MFPPSNDLASRGKAAAGRTVRLFVASPDDVERERQRVERVVERLNGEFAGIVRIEAICSQAAFQFHSGDVDFEDVPTPADCDSGPSSGQGNIERE